MLVRTAQPGTDVYYRIFNADGDRGRTVRQRRALHRDAASPDAVAGASARCASGAPAASSTRVMRDDGLVSVAIGVPDFDPRVAALRRRH